MARGQASITAVEAAIGVVLLLSVTATFALGPTPADDRVQLDAYANDALTILETEGPSQHGATRLSELVESNERFEREKANLAARLDRILPENVLFRVETEYGTAGYRLPDGVHTATATRVTANGALTLRVWYA